MKLKKIIEIKYQDNIINVDLDNATIIDGYIPILYINKIGEDKYIVITSVIKEDGTVLVPFRKSIATKDEVDNYLFDNDISVYKNNKAIYKVMRQITKFPTTVQKSLSIAKAMSRLRM